MTLYLLAERIFRIYSGGAPSNDSGLRIEDVKHMVISILNKMLKTETVSMPDMNGNPTGYMLASYNEVVHSGSYGNGATGYVDLPAVPVSLPLNKGVWRVSPVGSVAPYTNRECVPLQFGQYALIKSFSPMVSDGMILGNYLYEVSGPKIWFYSSDISNIASVDLTLVISDINELGDYDLLPIPSDYVTDVIMQVLQVLGVSPQVEDVVNDGNKQK